MDKLRDFLKSWPGRILLMLCLAPVVLVGLEGIFGGGGLSSNQVARVDDVKVDLSALQHEMTAIQHDLSQSVDTSLIDEQALKDQAFTNIINRTLLEVRARQLGMKNSDEMISRLLQTDPRFLDNGQFSNDLFARFLTQQGMTKDMLFANFSVQLGVRQLAGSIINNAIYPMPQVNRLMDLQLESRQLWRQQLPWQAYADKVVISDADIQAYYQSQQNALNNPAMVDVIYLQIHPDDVSVEPVSDDELQAAYQQLGAGEQKQLAQILLTGDDVSQKLTAIQEKLQAGDDFIEVAKQYSDDMHSIQMGTYSPNVFGADAPLVDKALATLNEGQLSEPVKTSFGTHIFKVVKVNKSNQPSFEQQKEQLRKDILAKKRMAAFDEQVVAINNKVADGYGIKDIADELKLEIKTLNNYRQTGENSNLNQPAFIQAAFDVASIQEQRVSDRIEFDGRSVWLQSSNYRAVSPMTLEQATPLVRERLTKNKASQLAFKAAQAMAKTINKDNVQQLPKLGKVGRQSPVINDKERVSLFLHKANKGDVAAWAVLTDEGASVLAGGEIITQTHAQVSDLEKSFAAGMMRSVVGQDHLEDYLHYLRQDIAVEINDDLLKGQIH